MINSIEEEIYKDITNYKGLYQVSNLGNVKSLTRNTTNEHIMKPSENGRYKTVELFKDGIGSRRLVHRLVAEAFIPNSNNYPVVNHIDGDKFNNYVNNLEWCNQSENVRHSYANGLQKPTNTRKVVRSDGKEYESLEEAARELDTNNKKIWKICNGNQKQYKGFSFRYKEE